MSEQTKVKVAKTNEEVDADVRSYVRAQVPELKTEQFEQVVEVFKAVLATIPEGSPDCLGLHVVHTTRGPARVSIMRTVEFFPALV